MNPTDHGRAPARSSWYRRFRASRWFLPSAAVLGVLLVAGGAYQYWIRVEHRFMTIAEGRLYRSSAMSPEAMVATVQEHGIRTVIDLRTPRNDVYEEHVALEEVGVRHVNLPSGITPEPEIIDAVLSELGDEANWPVLIHCKHGVGRSSLFEAFYRIEFEGWDPDRARRAARLRSGFGSFGKEEERGRMILEYEPRGRTADASS